ncbi:DUF3772 domain-containing protein [Roseobacter sp. YSTF-M11]|uniref:DUF3772 domain-containing protein n=1 Tax=Roseobacter insulae TaxID=2859783 RepID=A0A9X1FV21_9RHOB|nr:DUF3772 domain-containing protein [Roseobacter insulae]MBW4708172.1 DUF3772 domain-containing protein [Roseobacter insulae]
MTRVVAALASWLLALGLLVSSPVAAQEANTTDIQTTLKSWENVAALAEAAIDRDVASNERFERLRAEIAEYRSDFTAASQVNADRIATLRNQIEALGPVPESGEESIEIKARRTELNERLEMLLEPVRVAEEAFRRADGLIREIDTIIRDRQARRLLSLGPSPLNPAHWPDAIEDLFEILRPNAEETAMFQDPIRQQALKEKLPLILFLVALALALIIRGRAWAGVGLNYLRKWGGRGTGVWAFLVSLLRVFIPLTGLLILTHAIRITGMISDPMDQFLKALPLFGFVLLWFRWLAERLFSRFDDIALIPLPEDKRAAQRFYMLLLSIFFVSRGLIDLLLNFDVVDPATEAVLSFPIVVLISLNLAAMGRILRGYVVEAEEASDERPRGSGLARVLRGLGTAMIVVSLVSPIMAAVGYGEAGNALLYPTVVSLLILGFMLTLQRFFADVYCLVTKQGPEAREALVPVIAGFVLVLLSVPLLALAWGARVAELTEIWASFSRGFQIGDTRISPGDFVTFAVIFVVGYSITRLVQSTIRINVLPKTKIDIGGQNAIVSGLGYVGIFLAAILAVTGAGLDLSSLAIVAGALSVGIGFGLQTIVSNFVSGIILLIERPISEGDWIEVGGQMGYVRDISVRATRIETFDRTDVIVPNADLVSGTVTNYTRGNKVGRLIVSVGVAYGTDTRRVEAILREIAKDQPMVLSNPEPMILFNNFGADSLEFEMRMILRDVNWIMSVKNDINHAIAERFAKEGIEVPFAQRDIWLRNPETLKDLKS